MNLPPLREVIAAHELNAKKKLGQHFLLDSNLTDKIVRLSGDLTGLNLIEIGPGPGGLTRSILGLTGAKEKPLPLRERGWGEGQPTDSLAALSAADFIRSPPPSPLGGGSSTEPADKAAADYASPEKQPPSSKRNVFSTLPERAHYGVSLSQNLRKNATEAEKLLWFQLRAKRLLGYKFRRQEPIGPYIVDFCCYEARLVIELDGSQHLDSEYDIQRDAYLSSLGFTVLRFWNNEVMQRLQNVLEQIVHTLSELSLRPCSNSSPHASFSNNVSINQQKVPPPPQGEGWGEGPAAPSMPASLTVIEMDPRCQPILAQLQQAAPMPLHIIEADALKISLPQTVPSPRAIIANLPYNVGTPLLIHWLRDIAADPQAYRFLTLMFQKEVAERLYAPVDSEHYGRLSVLAQWLCDIDPLFDLPPQAFSPPPKVTSTVVRLTPKTSPTPVALSDLETITGAAFGKRRKMLRASLKSLPVNAALLLETCAIDPTRRAETLTPAEFIQLAQAYRKTRG